MKIEIDLSVIPPDVVEVRDTENNSVRIRIEYPKLPPKCCNCGKFGYLMNRCPKPLMRFNHRTRSQVKEKEKVKVALALPLVSVSGTTTVEKPLQVEEVQAIEAAPEVNVGSSTSTQRRARSRSRARARRRRSLSQLPSQGRKLLSSDDEEVGETNTLEISGKNSVITSEIKERRMESEKHNYSTKGADENTDLEPTDGEHLWLLPKAARKAQRQRAAASS